MIPSPRAAADAIGLLFDAFDAAEDTTHSVSYYDRESGCVDANAGEIVPALLAAGWLPPRPLAEDDEEAR